MQRSVIWERDERMAALLLISCPTITGRNSTACWLDTYVLYLNLPVSNTGVPG